MSYELEDNYRPECYGGDCIRRFHKSVIPKTVPNPRKILTMPKNENEVEFEESLMEMYREAMDAVTRLKAGIAEAVARHDIDPDKLAQKEERGQAMWNSFKVEGIR